jgi:hypothetical protein
MVFGFSGTSCSIPRFHLTGFRHKNKAFYSRGAAASPAPALREKKGHPSQVLEYVEVVLAEERKARGVSQQNGGRKWQRLYGNCYDRSAGLDLTRDLFLARNGCDGFSLANTLADSTHHRSHRSALAFSTDGNAHAQGCASIPASAPRTNSPESGRISVFASAPRGTPGRPLITPDVGRVARHLI